MNKFCVAAGMALCLVGGVAFGEGAAIAPKCLYSTTETISGTKLEAEKVVTVEKGVVTVAGSNAEYPCFDLKPAGGVWDLSPW